MKQDKKPITEVEALAKIKKILDQLPTDSQKKVLQFLGG